MEAVRLQSTESALKYNDAAATNLSKLLEEGVTNGVFPGAVFLVAHQGQIIFKKAVGARSLQGALPSKTSNVSIDTVFDIASLTNVLATTTLFMKLVEADRVNLEDRVATYAQGFGVHGKSGVTVGQLLNHTSGLTGWIPFFEELLKENTGARMGILTSKGARDYVVNAINRSALKNPAGTRQVYSDVGFILLGHLIGLLTGLSLEKAFQRIVLQPLGLRSTSHVDLSMIKRRGIHPVTDLIAPTEQCPWRERILCGEVHDDNAWAMGGIAGHSGIFSRAHDLHIFAREILRCYYGESEFLKRETLEKFWRIPKVEGSTWRHGWDSPSHENGMDGCGLSKNAVGINGFTGCSLWIEPEQAIHIVLMSNRVHPTRNNKKILSFRPQLHAGALNLLKGHS